MGLGADLDRHVNLAPHRAFVIYRPLILKTTVTVNTLAQPTFSILQIFLDVTSDKELVITLAAIRTLQMKILAKVLKILSISPLLILILLCFIKATSVD